MTMKRVGSANMYSSIDRDDEYKFRLLDFILMGSNTPPLGAFHIPRCLQRGSKGNKMRRNEIGERKGNEHTYP